MSRWPINILLIHALRPVNELQKNNILDIMFKIKVNASVFFRFFLSISEKPRAIL